MKKRQQLPLANKADPDSWPGLCWRVVSHPGALLSMIALVGALTIFNVLDCHGYLSSPLFVSASSEKREAK